MAKLDLQKLLDKKGWKLAELAKASGISQTVLRMIGDGVFNPTGHEARLIMDALAKVDPPIDTPRRARATRKTSRAGQLDLFGGPP